MNITFTQQELVDFAYRIGTWHQRRAASAIDAVSKQYDPFLYEKVKQAINKFDAENPEPKWHDMLK